MLGLGEQDDEIIDAMLDLRDVGEPDSLLSRSTCEGAFWLRLASRSPTNICMETLLSHRGLVCGKLVCLASQNVCIHNSTVCVS